MNNSSKRQTTSPLDSLDIQHQQFNRSKMFQNDSKKQDQIIFKNFYKQQLDQVLQQKNKYKMLERQKQQQQRKAYNQRLKLGQQIERIKEISYKNYYQMISNNQDNLKNKYISPFQQRDQLKNKLINKGYEQGKIRNQIQYQRQIKRQQSLKKQLQSVLNQQLVQKQQNQRKKSDERIKNNQQLRNILLTPNQIQQLEREKKLNEMSKYKYDLDKLTAQKLNLSRTQRAQTYNPQHSPKKPQKHDLLLNPLPYNIQNPYILRQMQKKNILSPNSSYKFISNADSYSPTKRNIFG